MGGKLIGTVYNSDKFGDYEIIYYGSVEDVLIRFHNTGYVTKSGMQRIRAGGVVSDRCYNALINYSVIERIRGFGMKTYLDIPTDINENCRGMSSAVA